MTEKKATPKKSVTKEKKKPLAAGTTKTEDKKSPAAKKSVKKSVATPKPAKKKVVLEAPAQDIPLPAPSPRVIPAAPQTAVAPKSNPAPTSAKPPQGSGVPIPPAPKPLSPPPAPAVAVPPPPPTPQKMSPAQAIPPSAPPSLATPNPSSGPTPTPTPPSPTPSPVAPPPAAPTGPRKKIQINEMATPRDLAAKLGVSVAEVLKKILSLGAMANQNQRLTLEVAQLVGEAFNADVEVQALYADENLAAEKEDTVNLKPRPPVVTVMGHVDHGKTSLLDAIRSARVAEKEAGGITQHIGAYQVNTAKGPLTFLDTPGHEAFTAMRARGAQATDLVVLVVAADDGVMPQTVEALDHARAAGVPIVVAINKCDLPVANPQRIKQALAQHNLLSEDWGGKTVMVEVSAKTRLNVDKLLEMISLEAELLELTANPDRPAQGVVVEARLDPRRGPVATVLVQKGTLRVGESVVCGLTSGKIRALINDHGERVREAPPSYPAEVLGLSKLPQAGDRLVVTTTEREARDIAERRQLIATGEAQARRHHLTLEGLHQEATAGKIKALPIVLKADVQGSLEAIRDSLEKLATSEIALRVIHAGIGGVNTSDIVLADASDAIILGFNVRPDPASEELARRDGVEIRTYRIIYDMINDVKAALEGLLEPEEKEVTTGWAEVRQVFRAPKVGVVAGCAVTDGKINRTGQVRVLRDGAIVFDGSLGSLRRFKDDVREVEKGYECGLTFAGFQDLKIGDRVEAYIIQKQARKL